MHRKRSRGDRTRRRERALARMSRRADGLLSPVEKTEYLDASGNRVTRYRSSPPTHFPQLPHVPDDDDDDDVGSLFQFRSSRLEEPPSPTSWKGTSSFVDDDEEFQKIISRSSTPGSKLRSMLEEPEIEDSALPPDTEEMEGQAAVGDMAERPTASRLSYALQTTDDDAFELATDMELMPMETPSPNILPRSSLEPRTSSWPEPSRASVEAVVPAGPGSQYVSALSVPPGKRAVELQRIRDSFSASSVHAVEDLPVQPSSTTAQAALLDQRRAGGAAVSDVPAQPSASKQVSFFNQS